MCGIAGWCLSTDDLKVINTRKLAKSLALGIEHRGTHATGVAFRTSSGSSPIQIHKRNVTASDFIKRMPMPRKAQVGLVHTRFATQGDPSDNNNNHPIANAGIVGVHNGHVSNDDELFKAVFEAGGERHGLVDSEAIFASIAWSTSPWQKNDDTATLAEVLESVEGGAAIAWLDEAEAEDTLHVARLNSSPLVFGWTKGGSLIFASEADVVKAAAAAVGVDILTVNYVVEGTAYKVVAGEIAQKVEFTPAWRYASRRWQPGSQLAKYDVDEWEGRVIELPPAKGYTVYPKPRSVTDVIAEREAAKAATLTFPELADDLSSPLSLAVAAGSWHWDRFRKREESITKFKNAFTCTGEPHEQLTKKNTILWNTGAFNRVGTWVRTKICGEDAVGQIYDMPDTFPAGDYVLRVLAWNKDRPHQEEWVLVTRSQGEFERHEDQSLRSNGDIDATVVLHKTVELSDDDIKEIRRQEEGTDAEVDDDRCTLEEMREWYLMQEGLSVDA